MKDIILKVRVDAETKARWDAACALQHKTLSELIRGAVEARIEASALWTVPNLVNPDQAAYTSTLNPVPITSRVQPKRITPCPHGSPPWKFCEECGS